MELIAPKEAKVIDACRVAKSAGEDYALKALIAGQLLLEYRASLCHDGKPSPNGRNQHSGGDGFGQWIEQQGVAERTAYRWMEAAERVCRAQLGIPLAKPFTPVIELEGGGTISLSAALTKAEGQLPAEALRFRQGVFEFMADHTLGEAARAVFDGESDAKRITLAAGGKTKGGTKGEDRKAFDEFAKTKLKHLSTFLGHKLTVNQKAQIVAAFDQALEQWPRWMIEGLAEKCRKELKLDEADRVARNTFEQ